LAVNIGCEEDRLCFPQLIERALRLEIQTHPGYLLNPEVLLESGKINRIL
jgi:hypothetical protein